MKVSVVVTVLNEAGTIKPLLDSLLEQSLSPREIIVVDAGSTDGTVNIIKHYSITFRDRDRGTNRSKARNTGIKAAKNEIIAITDAGCVADKHWLERLVKPFKDKQVISVAGYYRPACAGRPVITGYRYHLFIFKRLDQPFQPVFISHTAGVGNRNNLVFSRFNPCISGL